MKSKKWRGMLGIGKKLMLYFLALSLVPLIIGGVISFAVAKKQLEEHTEAHLSDLARNSGENISFYVSEYYQDIKMLSQADVFRGSDPGAMQKYLVEKVMQAYSFYEVISVIDPNGTIVACTREELIGQSRADREWFQRTLQSRPGEVVALDAYRAETAGWKIVIGFNAPIIAESSGEVVGVLTTRIGMDHIVERVRVLDQRTGKGNHAYLLNGRGEILAGPDEEEFLSLYRLHDFPVVRDLLAGRTGVSHYQNDRGEEVIGAYYALIGDGDFNGFGWGIIVNEPVSAAFKAAYTIRDIIITTVIVIASLVVLFSVFISKRFTRPIWEISESALRISRGDLKSTEIRYQAKDEVGDLVAAFNRMGKDLEATTVSRNSLVKEIVERKRAQVDLSKSEERYRLLVENAPLGILSINVQGQIIDTNPKLLDIFGSPSPEDARAINIFSFPPLVEAGIAEDFRLCLESGKPDIHERKYTSEGGKELYLRYHLTPVLDMEGQVSGALAIVEDISQRKMLERQLRQSQKMEAIGTLAGGIAHDFNNILTPIIGYVQMSMVELPEDSPLQVNLEEMLKSANRAKDLVKQILVFSRQTEQERKPLKIQLVLKEALKLLRASVPVHIEIHQDIDDKCGAVMADSTQIYQVLMNLCTNAYQAMGEKGGLLEVNLGEVDIGPEDLSPMNLNPGPYLLLTVSDTGHGMDRQVKERIFEPFFTTKGLGEGTGMGLSVVHGIISSYGGDIRVYSESGKGTTFHVYLPRIDKSPETLPPVSAGMVPKGTERILLVDDEEAIVRMFERMLERLGYQVTSRTSSVEALHAFRSQPDKFDLVITDLSMPNMNGTDLAKELLGIRPDIPIVLCTGFSEIISKEKAMVIGVREYIMKPVVPSQIAGTIRRVLDQEANTET